MDEQEIFNQINELRKQRTLLSEQDNRLVVQIMELRDKLELKSIKKGYYTDNNGLYCRVCDIKKGVIFTYKVDTSRLYIAEEVYPYRKAFNNTYCRECTKDEYDHALDYIIKRFKE